MPESILVTGGTGTLGRQVVERLLSAGHTVRVLSRHGPRADAGAEQPDWAIGDLRSGEGIPAAVVGSDVIVHCASGRGDVDAAQHLLDAARPSSTGEATPAAPHVVYISIVGVDQVPLSYYRHKLAVERLIANSGLPWTTLRATQFHDLLVRVFAAQRRLPVLMTPASISCQPVDAGEVAGRLVELALGEPSGRVADIGGPEVRSSTDLARSYLRATGRRRPVVAVPFPGAAGRGYRAGGHMTPEHADGKITFEQFLAR